MAKNSFSWKSYIEGPRWAGIQSALRKGAWDVGLDIEFTVEKGLLRETVFFEVMGDVDSVVGFKRGVEAMVREWEKPIGGK